MVAYRVPKLKQIKGVKRFCLLWTPRPISRHYHQKMGTSGNSSRAICAEKNGLIEFKASCINKNIESFVIAITKLTKKCFKSKAWFHPMSGIISEARQSDVIPIYYRPIWLCSWKFQCIEFLHVSSQVSIKTQIIRNRNDSAVSFIP